MQGSGRYDQEAKLSTIFAELKDGFKKADGILDISKQQALLRDLTEKMQDAKA